MIGVRIGNRIGARDGLAVGTGIDEISIASGSISTTTMTAVLDDSADPTPAGANFSITLVVTNTGSVSATTVSAAVTLDASLTFVSASGSGWTCGAVGQVVTCTRATMATGASPTITITVTAGNTAVTASTSVSVTAANVTLPATDTESTGVVRPTMTAVLNDSADPVINSKNFTVTLDLTNNGTGTINTASATVTLDANLTWVSSSGMTGWTLGHSGQNVTATKAAFAQGAATQLVITVIAAQSSTVTASTSVTVTADNAANATDTETTVLNFITRDATSGKYLPSTDTEWTNFIAYNGLGISNPTSLWTMQAASGNEASVIGGGYTLTANGSPGYRTAISGWSRTGQLFADGGSDRFSAALGTGTNPNTTSSFMLGLCRMPAAPSVADRAFWGQAINSAASGFRVTHKLTTGKVYLRVFGVSSADSASDHSSGVHLFGTKNDRAGSLAMLYTDLDKVTGTYSASVADQAKGWGSAATGGGAEAPMWSAEWTGAAAVAMTDAAVKALFQAIGYTITWS